VKSARAYLPVRHGPAGRAARHVARIARRVGPRSG
jgi:hypothetical protein